METTKTPYLKGEGLKGRNPQGCDSGPCEGPYRRASSSIEDRSQASEDVVGRRSVGDGSGMGEDRPAAVASAASCTAAPAGKRTGRLTRMVMVEESHLGTSQPKGNTFHVLKIQNQIRWEGRADKGISLLTGNMAVVILKIPRKNRICCSFKMRVCIFSTL